MRDCIADPKLQPQQLAGLFLDVAGTGLSAEQQNYVRVLVDNERLQVLPRSVTCSLPSRTNTKVSRRRTSPPPSCMDDVDAEALVADLRARFKAKLNVTVSVDPELIGGVRSPSGMKSSMPRSRQAREHGCAKELGA